MIQSDHHPFLATFLLTSEKKNLKRKIINWPKFIEYLNVELNTLNFQEEINASNFEKRVCDFTEIFNESLKKATFEITTSSNSKLSIPKDLILEIKNKRNIRRKYLATREEQLKKELNNLTKKIKQKITYLKKEQWETLCKNKDPKSCRRVWSKINALNGKSKSQTQKPLLVNDKLIENQNEIVEIFATELQSSFKIDFDKFVPEKKAQNFTPDKTINFENINLLTIQELKKAILSLKKRAAPGFDGVRNIQIFQAAKSQTFLIQLLKILNFSLKSGLVPPIWKIAKVIMILKAGKPEKDPGSYRPVSLLSCLCKLLEKIVNSRLIGFLELNGKISKFQNGFRKFRSTSDHLLRLCQNILEGFNNKNTTAAIFFDLKKAFDRT